MTFFKFLHILQLFIAICFSLFIAWVASENYFEGRIDKGIGTYITALVTISFAIIHLIVYKKRGFSLLRFIVFPVFYILLGLTLEYFSVGYRKNWAPVTESEANLANIEWFIITLVVIALALVSVFYKSKKH